MHGENTSETDNGPRGRPPFDYRQRARTSFSTYALLAFGLSFIGLPFFQSEEAGCAGWRCLGWIEFVIIAFGGMGAAIAGIVLTGNHEWGSRVDSGRRQLRWWQGAVPCKENIVAVDDIAVIRVETKWENHSLSIRGHDGKQIKVPDQCLPHPLLGWARALAQEFTHIKLETD